MRNGLICVYDERRAQIARDDLTTAAAYSDCITQRAEQRPHTLTHTHTHIGVTSTTLLITQTTTHRRPPPHKYHRGGRATIHRAGRLANKGIDSIILITQ